MDSVVAGQFRCDACGKTYRWKPELAGRKAKCKCGAVMLCPASEPAKEDISVKDDMYDLAPPAEEPIPARPVVAPQAAASAAKPSQSVPVASLAYRAPRDDNPDAEINQTINFWAPLFLIAGSIGGEIGAAFVNMHGSSASLGVGIGGILANMVGGTIFMMAGMWIAAKHREIKLGSFGTAMFKLCAISVAPSAAMDLVAIPLRILPMFGGLIALAICFICYFTLIGAFFDLDQEDTWYCVKVIFVLKVFTVLAILGAVGILTHGS